MGLELHIHSTRLRVPRAQAGQHDRWGSYLSGGVWVWQAGRTKGQQAGEKSGRPAAVPGSSEVLPHPP